MVTCLNHFIAVLEPKRADELEIVEQGVTFRTESDRKGTDYFGQAYDRQLLAQTYEIRASVILQKQVYF